MSDSLNALMQGSKAATIPQNAIQLVNPLAAITAGNEAAKAEYEARQWQARQAAGQVFQRSIDPTTGALNQADFMRGLSNTPMTALEAMAAAQKGQTLDKDTYDLHNARLSQGISAIGDLLGRHPDGNVPMEDAHATIDREVQTGLITPEIAAQLKSSFGANQRQNAIVATQLWQHNMSTQQQLEQRYGTTGIMQRGGVQTPYVQQPASRGGAVTEAPGSLTMTMTPDQLNSQVELPDPRKTLPDGKDNPDYGAMKKFTVRQQLQMQGHIVLDDGTVILNRGAGQPATSSLGNGRYPTLPPALQGRPPAPTAPATSPAPTTPAPMTPPASVGTNPNAPVVIPPPATRSDIAPNPLTAGGVQTAAGDTFAPRTGTPSPPSSLVPTDVAAIQQGMAGARATPGTRMAADTSPFDTAPISRLSPGDQKLIDSSGEQFNAHAGAAAESRGRLATLSNMLNDTSQFTAGPLAGIKGALRGIAIQLGIPGIDVEAQTARDSFNKLAAGITAQQGARSDKQLSISGVANPHETLSDASVDFILRQLQGNEDYVQTLARLAQQFPSKWNYPGFVDSVRQMDPRVFQYERMTDPQKQTWFKAMAPRDQAAFQRAHKWAEDKGLISDD